LARTHVAGDFHLVFELAQVAFRVERAADAAHGALAGARAQQLGQDFDSGVQSRAHERHGHEHHQQIYPNGIAAGLDAMDHEP
jgi:hypothetical protein